ncbi:MAG: hypothetical protein V9F06_03155 [Thermomicrobiales bacterium]
MHFIGVINKNGGTFRTMDTAAFAANARAGVRRARPFARVPRSCEGEDLIARARAGGQRSGLGRHCSPAAATAPSRLPPRICFKHEMPLAVLPGGTMNLFARSLQHPAQPRCRARSHWPGARSVAVDIATANGRPFVHQFSVGLHSRLVQDSRGAALSQPLGQDAGQPPRRCRGCCRGRWCSKRRSALRTRIETAQGGGDRGLQQRAWARGTCPMPRQVDQGVLGVYVVKPMPPAELARLVVTLPFGTWKQHPLVSEKEVHAS